MSRAFRLATFFVALFASWLALPAGAGERGPAAQQTPAALYHNYCSVCHGDHGDGRSRAQGSLKPPPRDFTTPQSIQELSRERMIAAVTTGVPGTAMMPWKAQLTDAQIATVVDYVRATFMRPDASKGIAAAHPHGVPVAPNAAPVRADMKLPLPFSLRGDAAAGQRFYDANCATCHGVKGDGQGPRAYFINPKPRVFTSAESRGFLNRPAIFAGVSAGRRGSEMPAWDKVLTKQQIANVSEYVFRAFIEAGDAGVAKGR